MKQKKIIATDALTKKDLEKALKSYPSKDDFREELKKYATRDDIIAFKDAILHEIVKLRDEVAIVGGHRDMLEDHETRIETIEKHLQLQVR